VVHFWIALDNLPEIYEVPLKIIVQTLEKFKTYDEINHILIINFL